MGYMHNSFRTNYHKGNDSFGCIGLQTVTTQVRHYHHRKVNGKHMFPFRLRIAYDSNSLL